MPELQPALEGRVALVTGASRGIGRALAVALGSVGAKVALTARSAETLAEAASAVEAAGGETLVLPADVGDPDAAEAVTDAVVEHWGGLDVVVNNAGVIRQAKIVDMSLEDWDAVLTTNLRGVFLYTRAAMRRMGEGGGSIVNVASNFGLKAVRTYGAYCASKAAVLHLTRVAALEGARSGIRVNALAPGYIETDLNADVLGDPEVRERIEHRVPMGRVASPDELVPAVLYLASQQSAYVTGECITIDGGFWLR